MLELIMVQYYTVRTCMLHLFREHLTAQHVGTIIKFSTHKIDRSFDSSVHVTCL